MELIRLVYASTPRPDLGYDALTEILVGAGEFNAANDITGMLCSGRQLFVQALEGPRTTVTRLYERITTDARHSDVRLLACSVADARLFAGWSMRMVHWDDRFTALRRAELLRDCGLQTLEPTCITNAQALALLQVLASFERRLDSWAVA